MGWVEMASDHAVVFRVDMPDQNMEALVDKQTCLKNNTVLLQEDTFKTQEVHT